MTKGIKQATKRLLSGGLAMLLSVSMKWAVHIRSVQMECIIRI